jgi:hypothetical protein
MMVLLVAAGVSSSWLVAQEPAAKAKKPQSPESQPQTPAPPRLMAAAKDARLRTYLPTIDDPAVAKMLADPDLLLYTDAEMPRAYQDWSGGLEGVHSPSYNISANGSEPHGNGNVEFPWGAPAGTHRAQNVSSYRFLLLPKDDQGRRLPVVWFRKRLAGDVSQGYAWTYPVGAVLGEVLMLKSPEGQHYTFEMRLRIREKGDWAIDVFRPFPTAQDLAARIRALRPDWQQHEPTVALVRHLELPANMPRLRLVSNQRFRQPFRQTMGIDKLPAIDTKLVAELLTSTPFKSAHGDAWRQQPGGEATFAPTTEAEFHVVPAKYDAGFIAVDRNSCMRCHNTVNQSVRRFDPGRDWYGRIRGSDGIFSFHPFAPGTVSNNGYGNAVRMRDSLVASGVIAKFNPQVHSAEIYNKVPHLVE